MGVDLGTAPVDMGTPPPLTGGGGCNVLMSQAGGPGLLSLGLVLGVGFVARRRRRAPR